MRLINTHTIIAAFSISLALVSASPTPWSEDLLEEINSLRARGMSEVRCLTSLSFKTIEDS